VRTPEVCCVCSQPEQPEDQDPRGRHDLRPYGPGGAPICYDCATRPEHEAAANAQFHALMDAAEATAAQDGKVIVLSTDGPRAIGAEELATASEADAYAVISTTGMGKA
jgi:hypothetical protein